MTVYEYQNYKKFVISWVRSQPKQGYGMYSKFADFLGTNSVVMTQIFKGDRDLNSEQAVKLSRFMGLSTLESDYFLLLVQRARAGSEDLRQTYSRQLDALRAQGQAIKNRIRHEQLTDQDKAAFYANWYVIATWLAATIPNMSSARAIAHHFHIPEDQIAGALRFMFDKGLLVKTNGRIDFGTNVIHVGHDSPYVSKHHSNWRIKAMQEMNQKRAGDLFYSAPMALSHDVLLRVRENLVRFVQETTKEVAASPSEKLACLNIDWFEF